MFYQQCMKKCGHQIIQISFTNTTNKWSGLNWICGNHSIFDNKTHWMLNPSVCLSLCFFTSSEWWQGQKVLLWRRRYWPSNEVEGNQLTFQRKSTEMNLNFKQYQGRRGPVWTGSCCSNALLARFSNKDNKDNVRLGLKIVASSQFPALFLFMNWSNFVNKAGLRMQPRKCNTADVTNELHSLPEGLPMVHTTACLGFNPIWWKQTSSLDQLSSHFLK